MYGDTIPIKWMLGKNSKSEAFSIAEFHTLISQLLASHWQCSAMFLYNQSSFEYQLEDGSHLNIYSVECMEVI